jgi:spore germination protein GerM
VTEDRSEQLKSIVDELSHPNYRAHLPCLPKGARFRNLLIDNKGLAYVDLSSEFIRNHPGGLTGEQFSIRCLALTLADNFPEITAVKILVDGSEIETIAGHIDASKPFVVDELRRLTNVR